MKRFILLVLLALAAMAPAMLFRLNGWDPSPLVNTAIFGVAVLAAGFMLSWGAEAAESYISQGLILAVVALITVLPEYAIDMYYAFQAGRAPDPTIHRTVARTTAIPVAPVPRCDSTNARSCKKCGASLSPVKMFRLRCGTADGRPVFAANVAKPGSAQRIFQA